MADVDSAPLPPNGYSQEDAALLAQTNPENIQATDESAATLKRDELLRHLDQLPKKGGGPNKSAVLLYICLSVLPIPS